MRKSKAFVLTSLWEDPGFVLVESGFNNCQVIFSNCPNGPSEIIGDDGGYLFESNSQSSLITTTINSSVKMINGVNRMSKKNYSLKKNKKVFFLFTILQSCETIY